MALRRSWRLHATELVNSGVSIEAVRHRLAHASTETPSCTPEELYDKAWNSY